MSLLFFIIKLFDHTNITRVFIDIKEAEIAKLKRKSVQKHKTGVEESFVVLWVKASDEVTPQKNLYSSVIKVVTAIHAIESGASFHCMCKDSSAYWLDQDTNKMVQIQPITCSDNVPTSGGTLEKFLEVQWDKMLINQRGQTDKHGKPWNQWSISGTLLLQLEACDHYLCGKVVSVLGSEGIHLSIKSIQVLKTMVIACITGVSNLANLSADKVLLQHFAQKHNC